MQEKLDYSERIRELIGQNDMLAFCSAFISGMICHMFVFCNHYPTYGGLHSFIDKGIRELQEGRWLASLFVRTDGYATIPMVNGMESVFFLALSAVCISKLFRMKHCSYIVISSILIECFPVVASRYTFLYMANVFAMAFLLSCIGVYMWNTEKKYSDICAIICFALSSATYQADISVALTLIVLLISVDIVMNADIMEIVKKTVRAMVDVALGLLIWLLVYKSYTFLLRYEFYTEIPSITDFSLWYRIRKSYGAAHWFLFSGSCFNSIWGKICVYSTVILICVLIVSAIRVNFRGYGKSVGIRMIFLILILFAMPIMMNYVFAIQPDQDRVYRLFSSYVVVFLAPIYIYGRLRKCNFVGEITNIVIIVLGIFLSWNCFVVDNTAYMNAHNTYEKEYSFAVRVVDRIEQHPEYISGMPVMFVPSPKGYNIYGGKAKESALDPYISGMSQEGNFFIGDFNGFAKFAEEFLHTDINFEYHPTEGIYIEKWPSKNCILVQDGVMYVRLY